MTDRELLEAAAKAVNGGSWDPLTHDTPNGTWNPLADDGDALRLAVRLEMDVFVRGGRWSEAVAPMGKACKEPHGADPLAATRRAIVRAAAAMGGGDE